MPDQPHALAIIARSNDLPSLLDQVHQCRICENNLDPNPVLIVRPEARLLIIGQAPGRKVHATGIPWNDPSGDRLRRWLNLSRESFYEDPRIAIIPMGFCYPGKGKSGDLPPRKECFATWHAPLMAQLPNIETTLLIGQYAQAGYLPERSKSLTDTVRQWRRWFPRWVALPHPSPRNIGWFMNNPWFEADLIPALQAQVRRLLG